MSEREIEIEKERRIESGAVEMDNDKVIPLYQCYSLVIFNNQKFVTITKKKKKKLFSTLLSQ